jgi:hypothetical protein
LLTPRFDVTRVVDDGDRFDAADKSESEDLWRLEDGGCCCPRDFLMEENSINSANAGDLKPWSLRMRGSWQNPSLSSETEQYPEQQSEVLLQCFLKGAQGLARLKKKWDSDSSDITDSKSPLCETLSRYTSGEKQHPQESSVSAFVTVYQKPVQKLTNSPIKDPFLEMRT